MLVEEIQHWTVVDKLGRFRVSKMHRSTNHRYPKRQTIYFNFFPPSCDHFCKVYLLIRSIIYTCAHMRVLSHADFYMKEYLMKNIGWQYITIVQYNIIGWTWSAAKSRDLETTKLSVFRNRQSNFERRKSIDKISRKIGATEFS